MYEKKRIIWVVGIIIAIVVIAGGLFVYADRSDTNTYNEDLSAGGFFGGKSFFGNLFNGDSFFARFFDGKPNTPNDPKDPGSGTSTGGDTPPVDTDFDSSDISLESTDTLAFAGRNWKLSYYVNHAYQCGGQGDFPFLVVEPEGDTSTKPLWVMLHGGGIGYFDESGEYIGGKNSIVQETSNSLLEMMVRYTSKNVPSDTFIGDRMRAGDRFALGSLCDHDLMLGLGQPYPNNPIGSNPTVDGLLANLAMVDAVTNGAGDVTKRSTNSMWILGNSAGSYGAYALGHNLWTRGIDVSGMILDSGVFTSAKLSLFDDGIGKQAESNNFDITALDAKLGPYYTDESLWLENTIGDGMDVPFFLTTQLNDIQCAGKTAALSPEAADAGYQTNCGWVVGIVAKAATRAGTSATQVVKAYPGDIHVASDRPGTQLQSDLRSWFTKVSN